MPRPRLLPTTVAFATLMLGFAGPAWPGAMPPLELERIQDIARKEGLPVTTIRQTGPTQLQVASEGALSRDAFIKRASLVAYFIFERLKSPVEEIEFRNGGEAAQACHILAADYQAYLKDRITKDEYERRLHYRGAVPQAPAIKAPVVKTPELKLPEVAPPVVKPAPKAVAPLAPKLSPLVGFSWGVGLNGGSYDAYQLEYGLPLLRTMDLRPSLQILSPFSPVNFLGTSPMQGLSVACDLLGTTRQDVSAWGLSFDGGLGARLATLEGAQGRELWPALHLRLGLRWRALTLGMRYPLFNRAGDPTGGWEAMVGVNMPLDGI